MAKVVSPKKKLVLAWIAPLIMLSASSPALAQGRDAKATTEAQKQEKQEQTGVRALGTTDLVDPKDPTLSPVASERRSSFAMGLLIGASLGSGAGFPNDPTKIGLLRYYTESGIGAGYNGRLWLGVALRDWLTVGLMFGSSGLDAGEEVVFMGSGGIHTEIFPLYTLGGAWRDAGLMLETGIGAGYVFAKSDMTKPLVDGAFGSGVGISAFYEGVRLGSKLGMGPYFGYEYYYSASFRGGAFVLGWRTAIYPRQK